MPENNGQSQGEGKDISLTDILQAHDVLLSILLGKIIARNKEPLKTIDQIIDMTESQEINKNSKDHIRLLLSTLRESIARMNNVQG